MNRLKKQIVHLLLIVLTAILLSFLAIMWPESLKTSFAVESHSVGVYWDLDCADEVTAIDWGVLTPGSTRVVNIFVRNEEVRPSCTLSLDVEDWTPPETSDFITLSWKSAFETIALGEVVPVTITLDIKPIATNTEFTFTISVSGISPPSVGSQTHYMVVRGLNNAIYYRMYDGDRDSWNQWTHIPTGATCDSPAATVQSGRLYITVRGLDGFSLWFGWINLSDDSFSGWQRVSGATASAPTLVHHNSYLILVVRGLDNRIYYRRYDCILEEWRAWKTIPRGATCARPAATVLTDTLNIVVRGFSPTNVNANNSLWHTSLDLADEDAFSGWTWLPGATSSPPTITATQPLNRLELLVRGLDNRIYRNSIRDTTWEGWVALPTGVTSEQPGGIIVEEDLHIIVQGLTGPSLWHCSINIPTDEHTSWVYVSGATATAPTLAD